MLLAALTYLLADLSPANVSRLQKAWTFHTEAKAPGNRAAAIAAFEATPVLSGSLLYVITPFDQVIALDPGTGRERWRFDPHLPDDKGYSEASARGVAVAHGMVYFGTLDGRLMAIDARSGQLRWQTVLSKGSVLQMTSPPIVAGDLVIAGSSIGDNARALSDHGTVRAYNARTGEPRWNWDPTPSGNPAIQTGSANAWAPLALDEKRDLLFVPTGSASPDFYGGQRPGDNRFANSVTALKASTGELVWSFQVVHHDLWDYDVASRPVLLEQSGKPAIGVLTKIGHYFLLDRMTGAPLLPVEERPAPQDAVEGEKPSPTQPFPAHDGVFTEQRFEPRTPWCAEQMKQLRYDGLFTPPSLKGSLGFPGNVGGANWGGGSWDARRGLIFVASNRLATAVRLIPRAQYDSAGHGETGERLGEEYAPQAGTPYGMVRRAFLDPEGKPCNREPWGALVAIEAATGKTRWQAPLSVSLGGPLAVNGLVFFGATIFETKFRAFSADTGQKVWESDLPYTAHSTPGTYIWKGQRYVVICAGGHGKIDGEKLGDVVIVYRLEK